MATALLVLAAAGCAHTAAGDSSQLTPPAAAAALPAGDGSLIFTDWKGPPITVLTHLPRHVTANTPIIFVMHGVRRDPDRYRNEWRALADADAFILITPGFDNENFPKSRSYNYGGFHDADGKLRPRDEWTFSAIDPLFREVRRRTATKVEKFGIYGHSAGGQFTHRYVQLMQDPLIDIAISANAGSYTMPVFDVDYPFGLRGAPVDEAGLRRAFATPLVVLLGTADNDPHHHSLPGQPEAMAQGPFRLARGKAFFATAQGHAERLHTPFNWKLSFAPGVAHSDEDMAPYAARIFAQHFGSDKSAAAHTLR